MENKHTSKAIVITSIFQPTEAVFAFSRMAEYQLIVVGDLKTPSDWQCNQVDFLSVHQQKEMTFSLAETLPYNHYCRKMLGYLKAVQAGADYIVDTDDDNIPKDGWGFPGFEDKYDCVKEDMGFVNIYQLYTEQKIWPRGLPLGHISKTIGLERHLTSKECAIGVWQGLADEDPDVDAIYRLTDDSPCFFREREPVVLGTGTICPFNSQNTMIRKELFPLLFLPATVTFRFTDILRGLIAQPIMWLYGYNLGFMNATVVQKRNPHNYMNDFYSEIPMYENCEKVVELVSMSISKSESLEGNLHKAYNALRAAKIVQEKEIISLDAWLTDLAKLNG